MNNIWGLESDSKNDKKAGSDSDTYIEVTGNHIFFYSGVSEESAINFNKSLQETIKKLKNQGMQFGFERPDLHIHINSHGGSVFDGISMMENILRLKSEARIITHVEGIVASAATFMSIIGEERIIHPHSYMLIHQLRAFYGGTYDNMQDNMKNLDELMEFLKGIYNEYSSVPKDSLEEILKHDIYFNAEKCVEHNLVDKIYG